MIVAEEVRRHGSEFDLVSVNNCEHALWVRVMTKLLNSDSAENNNIVSTNDSNVPEETLVTHRESCTLTGER